MRSRGSDPGRKIEHQHVFDGTLASGLMTKSFGRLGPRVHVAWVHATLSAQIRFVQCRFCGPFAGKRCVVTDKIPVTFFGSALPSARSQLAFFLSALILSSRQWAVRLRKLRQLYCSQQNARTLFVLEPTSSVGKMHVHRYRSSKNSPRALKRSGGVVQQTTLLQGSTRFARHATSLEMQIHYLPPETITNNRPARVVMHGRGDRQKN